MLVEPRALENGGDTTDEYDLYSDYLVFTYLSITTSSTLEGLEVCSSCTYGMIIQAMSNNQLSVSSSG